MDADSHAYSLYHPILTRLVCAPRQNTEGPVRVLHEIPAPQYAVVQFACTIHYPDAS